MNRRLVVSRDAAADLILIWVYHVEQNPKAAERIRDEITSKYDLLLQLLGRERDDLRMGLRSFSIARHIIFYREIEDGIEIVRVLHEKQDVPSTF